MNASTLIVSLDGIKAGGVTEVVQARGIDKVIVVASSTQFNDLATANTLNQVVAVKDAVTNVELALNSGSSLVINDTAVAAINSNGLSFVNDPSLSSFYGALVAKDGLIASGSKSDFPRLSSTSSTADLTLTGNVILTPSDSGLSVKPTISITKTGASIASIGDFNGTVTVNLSSSDFLDLLTNSPAKFDAVQNRSNLNVIQASNAQVDANGGPYFLIKPDDVPKDGKSRLGNLKAVSATRSTVATTFERDIYYWTEAGTLSGMQALALPLMGVVPWNSSVKLSDTASNLSVILPQLTDAQLASFVSFEVSDNAPLKLDSSTLSRLDQVKQNISWSNHKGTNVVNANGTELSVQLTANTIGELVNDGLFSNGQLNAKTVNSTGLNLVEKIDSITINNASSSDAASLKSLATQVSSSSLISSLSTNFVGTSVSADEFTALAKAGVTFSNGVKIEDTPANIESVLLSKDSTILAKLSDITGITSTSSPATLNLTWDQYIEITGGDFTNNVFENLSKVDLLVSGTAAEISALFSRFGTDFSSLQNAVSFKITDGGEVTLKVDQAEKLDGRITGAVLISDNSTNIGTMLKRSISDNIKDITTTDSKLSLSVDEFRNLPAYNNDDIVINDSEQNILKAISFDVIDDRVSILSLTDGGTDTTLTVTAAQAEKLAHYTVNLNGAAKGTIVVKDRASAIAEFIEHGDVPANLKLQFLANDGLQVELNYGESEALKKLILDEKATVTGLTKNGNNIIGDFANNALFSFDSKSIDARFTDIEGKVNTIDGIVDNILVDTGTTLDGKVNTIDGIVDDILVDTGTTLDGKVDNLGQAVTDVDTIVTRTEGKVDTVDNYVDTEISALQSSLNSQVKDLKALVQRNKGIAITGTSADVAAAMEGVNAYAGGITLTDAHTLAQLKTINDASDGLITLHDYSVALSGSSADVSAALAGTFSANYTGPVTLTDAPNVAQLKTINDRSDARITLNVTNGALTGLSADVAAALAKDVNKPLTVHTGIVTLTSAPSVSQLKAINAATTGAITLNVDNGGLSGSAADLVAAFDGVVTQHLGAVTITDAPDLQQLKSINAATNGVITLNVTTGALSGVAADVTAALSGTFAAPYTGDVTITGTHNLAQLKAINNATNGTITLANYGVALSGTKADVLAALAGTFTAPYTGAVTLTDAPNLAELGVINAATTGQITLPNAAYNNVLNGTAAAVAAALDGTFAAAYTGAVTVNNPHNLAQLKTINNGTTGTITLNNYAVVLNGTAADVAAALSGTFAANYTGAVTLTDNHTTAQLKAINNVTSGTITLANYAVALSGSAADVADALAGTFAAAYTGNVSITGNHTRAQLQAINNATSGTITLNNYGVALNGTVADVLAALAGTFAAGYTGAVTVTDEPTAAQLKTINDATTGTITLPNGALDNALSGTAAEVTAMLAGTITGNYSGAITLSDNPTLAQLKAINAATSGTINLNGPGGYGIALSGSSADIYTALSGTFGAGFTGAVTLTDAPNLAKLLAINTATSGNITLQVTNGALSGTAADLVNAFAGTVTLHTGAVTVTDNHTLAQLKTINNATSGTITLNSYAVGLNGSSADVTAALNGTFGSAYTGAVTLTNNHTISQLKTINDATTGTITLNSYAVALVGTTADVSAALDGTFDDPYTGPVTLTDVHTSAQLLAINGRTQGAIALNNYGVALSGSASQIVDMLAGTFAAPYTGDVTITGTHNLAQLKAINNATNGTITLANYGVALSGTKADVLAALAGTFTAPYTGAVTLTDAPNLAELGLINVATTGQITLPNAAYNNVLNGTAAAVAAALDGTFAAAYTGPVTVTNAHNLAQLKTINNGTTGTIFLSNYAVVLNGTAADVAAALSGTFAAGYTGNVTLTNAHTLAQLKGINNATSGTISLNDKTVVLNGSASDVAAALTGITGYTGNVSVNDTISIAHLEAIKAATSGSVGYNSVSGAAAALVATNANNLTGKNVTLTSNHNLAQLKAINNATTGTITLNSYAVGLSGTSADVTAALAGNFAAGYTGAVTLTDNPTLPQLKAINLATGGAITLQGPSAYGLVLSGTAADIQAALGGTFAAAFTGNVSITDAHNSAQLLAINNATSGTITLANYGVALSGAVADVQSMLDGNFAAGYTGNVTLTNAHNAAQLLAINGKTSGTITLNDYAVAIGGTTAEVVSMLDGTFAAGYTGGVTLTTAPSLAQLKTINNVTTGVITLPNAAYGAALSGTAANVASALSGTFAAAYTGAVTLNTVPTLAQLKTINNGTTGTITLTNAAYGAALSGSAADVAAALSGTFAAAYTGAVTLTDNHTTAQLKTINDGTTGTITLANYAVALSGSAADVAAALAGTFAAAYTGNVSITGNHTLAQLKAINNVTSGTITLNNYGVALNGSVADVLAALAGTFAAGYTGAVTVTDEPTAAQLKTINDATTGTLTLPNGALDNTLTGTSADVAAMLAGTIAGGYTGNVVLTDAHTPAQLLAINIATSGTITLNNYGVALSGTGAEVASMLTGNFAAGYTGNVTITNNHTSAQLLDINGKTSGTITLNNYGVALSGTAAEVADMLAGTFAAAYTGGVTLTSNPNTAQLKSINDKTSGTITLAAYNVALSGTAAEVTAALDGTFAAGYTGTAAFTNSHTLAQLLAVNNKTTGAITLANNGVALSGTGFQISQALDGFGGGAYTGNITLTGAATRAQIDAINAVTTGTISAAGLAISGTAAQVAVTAAALTNYNGNVTLTDAHTIAQLKAINNATTGTVAVHDKTVLLNGSSADVAAALNGTITPAYTGAATLTDAPSVAQLKTINNGTSGTITLHENAAYALPLTGSAADIADALAGTFAAAYTGNVTLSTAPTLAQLKAINSATTGNIVLQVTTGALSGSAADLAAAFAGTVTQHTGTVEVTNAHTLAQLKTINNASSGVITLHDYAVALNGSAADVKAALDGTFAATYTGAVTLTSNHTIAELKTINAATTGTITLNSYAVNLSGSAADLEAALGGTFGAGGPYTGTATLTNAPTLAQLKAINNGTTGAITLHNGAQYNVALSGSAADVAAALSGTFGAGGPYTGAVSLSTAPTLAQLKTINNGTTGTITLPNAAYAAALTGSAADVAAALAGTFAAAYTGNVVLNSNHTLAQLKTINSATSGTITLNSYGVALAGTSADVAAALGGTFAAAYTGAPSLTDNPTLAELKAINNGTSGTITLGGPAAYALGLTGSAADLKDALAGNFGDAYTGNVVISAGTSASQDIIDIEAATAGTLNGSAITSFTGTAAKVVAALADLNTKPANPATAVLSGVAAAADIIALEADGNISTMDGSAITAINGTAAQVVQSYADLDGTDPNSNTVTISAGNVTAADLLAINTATSGAIDGTNVAQITGAAADIISAYAAMNTDPANANIVITGTSTLAQLKQIDTLNGNGTINNNAVVQDTAAALLNVLSTEQPAAYKAYIEQSANVQITGYSNQNLTNLSNIAGNTTFELLIGSNTSISHAQAAQLNAIDQITVTANNTAVTLSGDSFAPAASASHFASLSKFTTSGGPTGASIVVADNTGTTGSVIDLNSITTISGLNVDVQGDTGANIIQLSHALTQSGLVSVDLKADTAADKLFLNANPASYVNAGNLAYTSVSNFDTVKDDLGIFYGNNHGLTGGLVTLGVGQQTAVTDDMLFVEQSKGLAFNGATNYDTVAEVRADIAAAVGQVGGNADKFLMAEYNSSGGQVDAYIFAGQLQGITSNDLAATGGANTGDQVEVASIARLLNVTQDSITANNLITDNNKPSNLST